MAFHKESSTYLYIAVSLYDWKILYFFLFFLVLRNGAWEIVHWEKVCVFIGHFWNIIHI